MPTPTPEARLQAALECLPALDTLAERVVRVHGPAQPQLLALRESFQGLADALNSLAGRRDGDASAQNAARHVRLLRGLSQAYSPAPGACRSYRSLFAGLSELDLGVTPLLARLAGLEPLALDTPDPGWRDAAACKHH